MNRRYIRENLTTGLLPYSVQVNDEVAPAEHVRRFSQAFQKAAQSHADLATMVHGVITPSGLHVRPGLNGRSQNWPASSALSLAFGGVCKAVPGSYHCPPTPHAWIPVGRQTETADALAAEIAALGTKVIAASLLEFPAGQPNWGVAFDFTDADELELVLSMLAHYPPEVRVWIDGESWRWHLPTA